MEPSLSCRVSSANRNRHPADAFLAAKPVEAGERCTRTRRRAITSLPVSSARRPLTGAMKTAPACMTCQPANPICHAAPDGRLFLARLIPRSLCVLAAVASTQLRGNPAVHAPPRSADFREQPLGSRVKRGVHHILYKGALLN